MSSQYNEYKYYDNSRNHIQSYLLPKLMPQFIKSKNGCILDIGCGNGWLAEILSQEGFEIYGIDASDSGIDIANKRLPGHFFIQDLSQENLPDPLQKINFDTIISTEVIEHLYDPRSFILFCKRILEKNRGGQLILSTPYHGYIKNVALALSGKMDSHFTALWDGGHIKFWSKATISTLLEEQGFKIEKFTGAGRIPYLWKSMIVKASLTV